LLHSEFEPYLKQWSLLADGEPIITLGSRLLPVRMDGTPAMLKIAIEDEEKFGGLLMSWWAGEGAARVYAQDGAVLLLERAEGQRSLLHMALNGEDDEASRIICTTMLRLHAPRSNPPPLIPLTERFQDLALAAEREGGIFRTCAATAQELLASPGEVVVLHGDVHHENILDFGRRGWLVIDPKRLVGERGFDYANLICNPQLPTATNPARFARQVEVVAHAASLERRRLLQWVLAFAGLSAAWFLEDDDKASALRQLQVAHLAAEAVGA